MASIDKRPLKAYVRFDGAGRIVPSSLILRRKMPKVGKWIEIAAYQCCNTTTTTTTALPQLPCVEYVLLINRQEVDSLTYTDCSNEFTVQVIPGPSETLFCALQGTPVVSGTGILLPLGSCNTTTTTTTACPATEQVVLGEGASASAACTAFGDASPVYTDNADFSLATVLFYLQGCSTPGDNYFSDGNIVRQCVNGVLGPVLYCTTTTTTTTEEVTTTTTTTTEEVTTTTTTTTEEVTTTTTTTAAA